MRELRERLNAIISVIKLILSLAAMAAMAYAFTFYLDGDIGVVVFSFLLITPLLSFLLTHFARKRIQVTLDAPAYIAKGKHFSVNICLSAEGKLPIPFLRIGLRQNAAFQPEDERDVQTSMMSGEPIQLPYRMTAVYAGCSEAALDALQLSDYLGLLHFPLVLPDAVKVAVIPEIPSLTGAGVMLRAVSDVVLTQDEEEEESSAAFSTMSMPGYIHRDYVPGDSLRRINWKLSAKRDRLMVRMDEAASAVRPSLILDLAPADTAEALKQREVMMEGALAFLLLLVQQGIPCGVRYASDGAWKTLSLDNEDAVRTAAVELAAADFRHDGNRLDRELMMEKAGAYMIYSANPDAELLQAMADLHDHGYICCVLPESLSVQEIAHADAVWTLSDDYTMTALQK